MRTIKGKLFTSLGLLCLSLAAVATTGYLAAVTAENGLETVYQDRVKPLRDLKVVADLYAVNIVDATHKVRNGGLSWEQGIDAISKASSGIAEQWKAYMATYMEAEERQLAAEAERNMKLSDAATARVLAILRAHDQAALDNFVRTELYPSIEPVSDSVSKLVELQIKVAEQVHHKTSDAFVLAGWSGLASLLVAIGSAIFAAWTALYGVIRPLAGITTCMRRLADGDLNLTVAGTDRRDEIGAMAASVQVFKDNAEAMQRLREQQVETERATAEARKSEMNALAQKFRSTVGGIVETVSSTAQELEHAAGSLTKTAESTQAQSGIVAAASEQTSANVQGVAAAAEELAATVDEISRQVQHSSQIAQRAVGQAATTNQRVNDLSSSASRIGDVITLINSIAGQTNLLALNATIEAARAGEAGKGFAVVAQEVKQLAEQTAKATNEISEQISTMQAATSDAVTAIGEITETIDRMSEISGAIAAAVEQQGATTREISRNVMEAAKGTTEVACNITNVSRGANDTGSASGEVLASARRLSSDSSSLRSEVEAFIRTVQAA